MTAEVSLVELEDRPAELAGKAAASVSCLARMAAGKALAATVAAAEARTAGCLALAQAGARALWQWHSEMFCQFHARAHN